MRLLEQIHGAWGLGVGLVGGVGLTAVGEGRSIPSWLCRKAPT